MKSFLFLFSVTSTPAKSLLFVTGRLNCIVTSQSILSYVWPKGLRKLVLKEISKLSPGVGVGISKTLLCGVEYVISIPPCCGLPRVDGLLRLPRGLLFSHLVERLGPRHDRLVSSLSQRTQQSLRGSFCETAVAAQAMLAVRAAWQHPKKQ
jgi:hypothetical protein